jgi:predicted DNA-binding transcriptional regulator YafY
MKTLRLFSLLDRLRSASTPVSAEALADMLEVSPRTIYRDMATLVAMGAPVRGEAGLGYQLEKGYFLPPLHFDADELEAIMLGVRLVMARGDGDLGAAAQRVSGKISSTMQAGAGDRYKNLPLRAVSKLTEEHSKANLHLSFLRRAVRDRVVVTLEYLGVKVAMISGISVSTGSVRLKLPVRCFGIRRGSASRTICSRFKATFVCPEGRTAL